MLSGFFKEPLVPIKASSKPNENQSLAKSLDTYRSNKEIANVAPLADFLKSNPESRWTPALELNVGTIRFESGHFSEAESRWRAAWDATKSKSDPMEVGIAESAISQLVLLEARLGKRVNSLKTWLLYQGANLRAVQN